MNPVRACDHRPFGRFDRPDGRRQRVAGLQELVDRRPGVVTPAEAVALGADHLVIGRPITQADDPVAAAKAIAEELG